MWQWEASSVKLIFRLSLFFSLALHLNYFKWLLSLNNSSSQNCKSLVLHNDTHDISIIKQFNLKFYVCVIITLEWNMEQWENISLSLNAIFWRLNGMRWADFKCSKHASRTSSIGLIKECIEYKLLAVFIFNYYFGKDKAESLISPLCPWLAK